MKSTELGSLRTRWARTAQLMDASDRPSLASITMPVVRLETCKDIAAWTDSHMEGTWNVPTVTPGRATTDKIVIELVHQPL